MTAQEKEHSSESVVWEEIFTEELTSDLEFEKKLRRGRWGGGAQGKEQTVPGGNLRQGRKKSKVSYMLSLLEYNVQDVVWG